VSEQYTLTGCDVSGLRNLVIFIISYLYIVGLIFTQVSLNSKQ